MLLEIKLYGGMVCSNRSLPGFGLKKVQLEVVNNTTLREIHSLLGLSAQKNLVNIVDGSAQMPDYLICRDCSISIFPPMADR